MPMRALSDMQKAHRKAAGTALRRAQSRTRLSCSPHIYMISQFCSVHNSRLCILHVCQEFRQTRNTNKTVHL